MDSQTLKQGRGRPSKYREEYPDKLIGYFTEHLRNPFDRQIVEKTIKYYPNGQTKESFEKYKTVARATPTLFAFAQKIGVSYPTVKRWPTDRVGDKPEKGQPDRRPYKYPEFRYAYKQVIDFQTEFINTVGNAGAVPPAFLIFAAKNMIGWRDAIDQRFVDGNGKDIGGAGSYVLLPAKKTAAEAAEDFEGGNDPEDSV